jgi:MoxR-like ATPase
MSTETDFSLSPEAQIFRGDQTPHDGIDRLPAPPPWRNFADKRRGTDRGAKYESGREEIVAVNTALYLRRPLLVTGKAGSGKTSLAYAVAHELKLGDVFAWPITSRSTLQQGLYQYDAIQRLHDASLARAEAKAGAKVPPSDIGRYVRLGPLGAAFRLSKPGKPRVLLIDEIDKSDLDLPNDLLHLFEEGEFEIPELSRLSDDNPRKKVEVGLPNSAERVSIEGGVVRCTEFPLVFLTSNGEREFPPAFLRRCIRLDIVEPDEQKLAAIVAQRLKVDVTGNEALKTLIRDFIDDRDKKKQQLATDQLLNAISLVTNNVFGPKDPALKQFATRDLGESGGA